MNSKTEVEAVLRALPLNSSLLVMDPDTERFFKEETGIRDGEELRKHIIEVQTEAYKVIHRR